MRPFLQSNELARVNHVLRCRAARSSLQRKLNARAEHPGGVAPRLRAEDAVLRAGQHVQRDALSVCCAMCKAMQFGSAEFVRPHILFSREMRHSEMDVVPGGPGCDQFEKYAQRLGGGEKLVDACFRCRVI